MGSVLSRQKLKFNDDYYFEQSMDAPQRRTKDMAPANLRVNHETTRNHERPVIKPHNGKTDEGISPRPISLSRIRHLDVDAVLARSLPKVANE